MRATSRRNGFECPDEGVAAEGCHRERGDRTTVGRGQRGKRGALQAKLRVLAGDPRRVAIHPEVLERMQASPRLRDEQRNEGDQDDRFFPISEQGGYLCADVSRSGDLRGAGGLLTRGPDQKQRVDR